MRYRPARPDTRRRDEHLGGAISPLEGRVVRPDELSEAERERWREICRTTPSLDHPFYSLAYAEAVARARPDVQVAVLGRAGAAEAFLPFQFAGAWARMLGAGEQLGGDMSDYFGLIAPAGFRTSPEELLRAAGLRALPFRHLIEDQLGYGLGGERPEPGHRIVIGPDPAEYLRRLRLAKKGFASETERRQRRIVEELGPLRFELAAADPTERLTRLIALKRERYRTSHVEDALAPAWKRSLLVDLAGTSDPDCSGVLSELWAGETWVAAHFGLRNRHLLHYWFPVYNDALAKFAPGHLLIRRIIEESAGGGLQIIDRGSGDQPHKSAWATEQRRFYRGIWQRPGPRAFVYRAHLSLGWRIAAWRGRSVEREE